MFELAVVAALHVFEEIVFSKPTWVGKEEKM
jgi:hypothetical protein